MNQSLYSDPELMPPPSSGFFAKHGPHGITYVGEPNACFGTKVGHNSDPQQGIFAEWHWDGTRLTARNDRYGFFPMYVFQKGHAIGISPSIPKLVSFGADTSLDYAGIAVALRLGQFVGNDSPFQYIRALPPNSKLEWDGISFSIKGRHDILTIAREVGRDEAIESYIDLFGNAIRRCVPSSEDFAVPLSGGRDSRHILFELVRNGLRPAFCLTYKTSPEDVRVAREICFKLNLTHVVVDEPRKPYFAEVKKNWLTNFGVDEGAYPIAICETLKDRGTRAIFDGIAGDVLSAGLFLDSNVLGLFQTGNSRRIANVLLGDEEDTLKMVLTTDLAVKAGRELAIARLASEVERHFSAHNPVTSFYFWNRTRRKIALTPYAMYAEIPQVFAPYLDFQLFDFLISLPAKLIIDHTLHTEAIYRAYPDLSDIPFEAKLAAPFDYSNMYASFALDFSKHVLLRRPPALVNSVALKTKLALSRFSPSFGASQQWFFRRAAWVYQLGYMIDGLQKQSLVEPLAS